MSEVETEIKDTPPRPAGLQFPNPSGRAWAKEEPQDKAPKGKNLRTRTKKNEEDSGKPKETKAQRKARLERRLGRGYVAAARGIDSLGLEYPSAVLLSQSEGFVDSVIALADEHPRILDWLDSDLAVPATWQFAGVCIAISVPILAYYGFLPEVAGDIAADVFGAPPLPPTPEEKVIQFAEESLKVNGNGGLE